MNVKYCFREKILARNYKYYLCYYKGCLYLKNSRFENVKKIRIHKWYKSIGLYERLLRKEPRASFALNDHVFIYSDCGYIYSFDVKTLHIECMHKFSKGMNSPLSFCLKKDLRGNVVEALYGEYKQNENKEPISVYKFDLKEWKRIYSFPANTIKHIHHIMYDVNRKRYLILTGDSDRETAIWQANDDFSEVSKIIGDKQVYRSCICMPSEKGLYYATDTPLEENYLCLLTNDNLLKKIAPIHGPCVFGLIKDETLFFATSVEGNPKAGKLKYMLSNKLGEGVKDRFVHILSFNEKKGLVELFKLKKDYLPMTLFQFGNASFVDGGDLILFSTQSTKKRGTYSIIINDKEGN